jgi:polysaccharide pyruvyl transferase WcaK-like protein
MDGYSNVSLTNAIEPFDRPWSGEMSSVETARAPAPKPCRIALFAHCGTGNLGDEASVDSVLQLIRSRWPAASLVAVSMDPEDTARRHKIPCFAMRQRVFPFEREWSSTSRRTNQVTYAAKLKAALQKTGPLFRAMKAIRRATIVRPAQFIREIVFLSRSLLLVCELDLLVISGGGQLLDWGGPWAFPFTVFKWILLAKCAGAKCIFVNSGAGPLDDSLSRWFARRSLSMADYVSLRDRDSGELLRRIGYGGKFNVVGDSVWALRLPNGLVKERSGPESERVIGIAPMAYGVSSRHWVDDDECYRRLIGGLAEFSGRMLQRGHRIKLFSSDIWFDSQAIVDLEAAIHEKFPAISAGRVTQEPVADIADLLAALSQVDCYITCRFHGVIFASLADVPSLALAPHPKVSTLMNDMGLSDYCVDIAACDAEWLTAQFDRLVIDMDDVKGRVRRHHEQIRSLLESQFDCLFQASAETHRSKDFLSIRSMR